MKTNWDVIIAGAGPAGAMAAMRLAAAGVVVLALDRARFPRDKPCGGGLTPKAFRQLDFDIGDLVKQRSHRVYLRANSDWVYDYILRLRGGRILSGA